MVLKKLKICKKRKLPFITKGLFQHSIKYSDPFFQFCSFTDKKYWFSLHLFSFDKLILLFQFHMMKNMYEGKCPFFKLLDDIFCRYISDNYSGCDTRK